MSWNIPTIEGIELVDRKDPPISPEEFKLAPINMTEAPKPAPVSMTGVVSFYDFTDRRAVEAIDAHAEEVSVRLGNRCLDTVTYNDNFSGNKSVSLSVRPSMLLSIRL